MRNMAYYHFSLHKTHSKINLITALSPLWLAIPHIIQHNVTGLSEMYCNQVYPHERVGFGHETTWTLKHKFQLEPDTSEQHRIHLFSVDNSDAIFWKMAAPLESCKTFQLQKVGFQNLMSFKYSLSKGFDTLHDCWCRLYTDVYSTLTPYCF